MIIASIFGLSDQVRDTLLTLFVVIPLALLWVATLVHIVRRRDLNRLSRLVWLVVVGIFPLVGTLIYLISQPSIRTLQRMPGTALGQAATTSAALGAALDNFATTASLAQTSLVQAVGLIEDMADLIARADAPLGFTVPFTRIRPLGPAHAEARTLGMKMRALGHVLGRTANALGTNAADLRVFAGDVTALAGALGADAHASEQLLEGGPAPLSPPISSPPDEVLRVRSGPESSAVSGVSPVHVPTVATPGPAPSP